MGSISLEGVQKMLHLDVDYPQFKAYVLNLEFVVDGVAVHAVANVSWRCIQVNITDPYQILAFDFQPALFALQVSAMRRREILKERGITEAEDFIERCKIAYHRHVTYLRLKPEIDAAQSPIVNKHRTELNRLKSVHESVRARVTNRKSELREQFKADFIAQKPYQLEIKALNKEEFEARCAHSSLERKIEMKLEEIQNLMIDKELSREIPSA